MPAPVSSGTDATISDYTRFDLAGCTMAEQSEEGASADYRCPGRAGTMLFVHEGDGRFDLDAGSANGEFQTIGAFNSIGETIEWRLRAGRPVAVIFRYRDDSGQAPGRTVLAVEKVGGANAPGCRMAHIAGDVADANHRARAIADQDAAKFVCGTDAIRYLGNAR